MNSLKLCLLFSFITGVVLGQEGLPDDIQNIANKVNEIPGLENFNQSNVPSLEEAADVVKKKCEKHGGENAYDKLLDAKNEVQKCMMDNFNVTQIQEEVEKAKSTGSMDEVFAKYCAKKQLVYNCVKNLTDSVSSCLSDEEKENLKIVLNVTDSLANFVCFKDGDRIAMFVAEGGVECLQSQKDSIQKCMNDTFGHRVPENLDVNSLPAFLIGAQECSEFDSLQQCVVRELEKCKDNTPANIVDALFKFIRRETPCKSVPLALQTTNDVQKTSQSKGNPLLPLNYTLLLTAISIFLYSGTLRVAW